MQGLSDAPAGLPADVRKALENADQLLGGGVILYGEMRTNMRRMKEARRWIKPSASKKNYPFLWGGERNNSPPFHFVRP